MRDEGLIPTYVIVAVFSGLSHVQNTSSAEGFVWLNRCISSYRRLIFSKRAAAGR